MTQSKPETSQHSSLRSKKSERSSAHELIALLRSYANPANVAGMARFGINPQGTLGIPIPILRRIAKDVGRNQLLAEQLWSSGIHEARTLASLIAEPQCVTNKLMDRWVRDFDSWDVCDQVCGNLFRYSPLAWKKAQQWSHAKQEYVKRAGFVLMAGLTVADKQAVDAQFIPFLALIEREAYDERNFVKKAVNWALRQIGKRNAALCKRATATAHALLKQSSPSAHWIARDALREWAQRTGRSSKKSID